MLRRLGCVSGGKVSPLWMKKRSKILGAKTLAKSALCRTVSARQISLFGNRRNDEIAFFFSLTTCLLGRVAESPRYPELVSDRLLALR
jgi:hypothetical protein